MRDFDREHFCGPHLLVQKFHDAPKLLVNSVGHKDHADPARTQVEVDLTPEGVRLLLLEELAQALFGVAAGLGHSRIKSVHDLLNGPVGDPIGGVIKHLGDDLAPRSRIGRALHLHENGDAVAIEKEVVQGPMG